MRREVREVVGLEVTDPGYVTSSAFVSDDRSSVVNVVFRAKDESGTARGRETEEVAAVHWLSLDEIVEAEAVPEFTREYVELAEADRRASAAEE
ncbi:MAG: ADP-ribose pyrophosphatase YjhB (NUDIX family) [Natronomonas sp.]